MVRSYTVQKYQQSFPQSVMHCTQSISVHDSSHLGYLITTNIFLPTRSQWAVTKYFDIEHAVE